jgi:chromosome partitioning protein
VPAQVFVSYSSEDAHHINKVVDGLQSAGLRVWRDKDILELGQPFWPEIERAIKSAGCLLVFVTEHSVRNDNVKREVEFALANSVPILPLLKNTEIPYTGWWGERISDLHCIEINYLTQRVLDAVIKAAKSNAHRVCKTIAIFNMKGGVGKSTIAAHLATRLTRLEDKSVLLIDLDPQQNLTEMFLTRAELFELQRDHRSIIGLFEPIRIGNPDERFALKTLLETRTDLPEAVQTIPFRLRAESGEPPLLDIVASQFEAIKYTEIGLDQRNRVIDNFMTGLAVLKRYYDFIIIDCNPSASLLTRCALRTCDRILAPIRPDDSARRGLIFLKRAIEEFYELPKPPPMNVLINFVRNPEIKGERLFINSLRKGTGFPEAAYYKGRILSTEIPESDLLRGKYVSMGPARGMSALARFVKRFAARGRAQSKLEDLASEYVELIERGGTNGAENQGAA